MLEVWNKADRLSEAERADAERTMLRHGHRSVLVSARTGEGVEALLEAIDRRLGAGDEILRLEIPAGHGRLLSWLHAHAEVLEEAAAEMRRHHRPRPHRPGEPGQAGGAVEAGGAGLGPVPRDAGEFAEIAIVVQWCALHYVRDTTSGASWQPAVCLLHISAVLPKLKLGVPDVNTLRRGAACDSYRWLHERRCMRNFYDVLGRRSWGGR